MKVVFVGNCQAYSLFFIFRDHLATALGYEVDWVDAWNEHRIDDWRRSLETADLVVRQHFTGETRVPVDALCQGKRTIGFPDVRGSFLWPYGNVPHVYNPTPSFKGGGPYDPEVGDSHLNSLIRRGISPEEALDRYLDHDIARATQIDRVIELALEGQRRRDQDTDFAVANFIDANFRRERLFTTQGHLSLAMFRFIAAEIYGRLGAGTALIDEALNRLEMAPFEPWHDAPIHPNLVAHLGLSYGGADFTFHHVQEGGFTFAERVIRYMNTAWSPDLHQGLFFAWQGNLTEALTFIERGLVAAPRSAHGFFGLANVLKRLERFDEARVAAAEALRLEPRHQQYVAELDHIESIARRN